jgi:hypothetical protein
MKLKKWLENWDAVSLKIKTPILEMEWKPQEADKKAAWDMYIELLTRITTQPLAEEDGIEKTALASIHSIFEITRKILKFHGRDCAEFAKISIVILNQIVRPFTARWHKLSKDGELDDQRICNQFRLELRTLQRKLIVYTKMLADIAGVEDLTEIEENKNLLGELAQYLPQVTFEESDPKLDHAGDVDYVAKIGCKSFGIQIKPVTAKANFSNYSPSEYMKTLFKEFEEQYGGKIFIVFSLDGKIANKDVLDEIRHEIDRLSFLQ